MVTTALRRAAPYFTQSAITASADEPVEGDVETTPNDLSREIEVPTGLYLGFGVKPAPMNHWLLKSEPDVFSFDHLKKRPKKTEPWNGVRNYQVRNMMRDQMNVGDLGFFYHSSCPVPGIAGVVKISKEAYPDPTQFDPASEYFDAGSKREEPRWLMVDVKWEADFSTFVSLEMLRADPKLADLLILRRGNRLSITPVDVAHFKRICALGGLKL